MRRQELIVLPDQMSLKTSFNAIALLTLLLFSSISSAEEYISPDTIAGSKVIDAETLIQLAQELDDLVIIDARIHSDRRQGYIANSVSLPDTETDCNTLFRFVYRKTTPVVFYCNGPRCRRSDKAVRIAVECGYKDIYWFRGGIEEWLKKQYLIHK